MALSYSCRQLAGNSRAQFAPGAVPAATKPYGELGNLRVGLEQLLDLAAIVSIAFGSLGIHDLDAAGSEPGAAGKGGDNVLRIGGNGIDIERERNSHSAVGRELEHLLHERRGGLMRLSVGGQGGVGAKHRRVERPVGSDHRPHIQDMLGAPVASPRRGAQVPGRLLQAIVGEGEHGIVPVGMDHDGVKPHARRLRDPVLPIGKIPCSPSPTMGWRSRPGT